jgi:hypothetical protein
MGTLHEDQNVVKKKNIHGFVKFLLVSYGATLLNFLVHPKGGMAVS